MSSATDADSAGVDATTTEGLDALVRAYDKLPMSVGRYVLVVLLPAVALVPLSVAGAVLLPLPFLVRLPIPLLGLLLAGTAALYPKLRVESRRHEMETQLAIVITHMTVLSTTNIDRMEVFRSLADQAEYGALATELRRIVELVDTWNQSLDDACRIRAKRVESEPVSDFFDRLAYSLGAGQDLADFLVSEQNVIIEQYATAYESSLDNLEVLKDLYLSMILSMTFALVFATVLPILTGTNPTLTVAAVIVLFFFIQIGFAYAVKTVTPTDPMWYNPEEIPTESERYIWRSLLVGVALSGVVAVITMGDLFGFLPVDLAALIGVSGIPTPIYLAMPTTPLLVPGLVLRTLENRVVKRDDEFPSFIRALGASESAKQSTSSMVLSDLRRKDFGELTPAIDDLYKRLNMRIEPSQAWRLFAAETRSYLIQKYTEMYLVGRQMGGDPKQLGELISTNMNRVLQLRESRRQSTVTIIGLLYGITAASTFAFFIGLEIVSILSNMSLKLNNSEMNVTELIHTGIYDIPLVQFLLLLVVLFNAMLSSLIIRTVDGGHKVNAYTHFVAMTWLGVVVAIVTRMITGGVLSI